MLVPAMPSPTSTCALRTLRYAREHGSSSEVLPDSCSSGVGPLRIRRRLTRAQRRSDRRSARRNAWLRAQEEGSPHIEGASGVDSPAVPASPPPPSPRRCVDQGDGRVSNSSSESNNNGSSAITTTTGDDGHADQANDHEEAPARLASPLAFRDLNRQAVNPAPAPVAGTDRASAPGLTAKEALQQRLLLFRRRDGLIDITIRTMKLMRRNQLLQHRLIALQAETRAFVRSVLNNPENRGLRQVAAAVAPKSDASIAPAP